MFLSDEAEEFESIPNEVLTEAASLPSALQVFASVGGLALLARHLPTFYPEVTRQVMPSEGGSKEGNLSTDWVTVESEDIYEVSALPAALCSCQWLFCRTMTHSPVIHRPP